MANTSVLETALGETPVGRLLPPHDLRVQPDANRLGGGLRGRGQQRGQPRVRAGRVGGPRRRRPLRREHGRLARRDRDGAGALSHCGRGAQRPACSSTASRARAPRLPAVRRCSASRWPCPCAAISAASCACATPTSSPWTWTATGAVICCTCPPHSDQYGYFTPTRRADEAVNYSVRPAQQGWGFTYAEVELDRGEDPRIDLVGDGTHYKMWDVNNDHLVDVVRTTGTVMQTWMNLGWAEGGEGRFGQAAFNSRAGRGRCPRRPSRRASCTTATQWTSPTPRCAWPT
jgi:hypothetical protein